MKQEILHDAETAAPDAAAQQLWADCAAIVATKAMPDDWRNLEVLSIALQAALSQGDEHLKSEEVLEVFAKQLGCQIAYRVEGKADRLAMMRLVALWIADGVRAGSAEAVERRLSA